MIPKTSKRFIITFPNEDLELLEECVKALNQKTPNEKKWSKSEVLRVCFKSYFVETAKAEAQKA